jgi:hypothetical protein
MPDRIALKRLTASDLTFFEALFRTLDVGNQKSINLNADIFIERFYPNLPAQVTSIGDVINVTLTLLGPAGAGPYVLSRAITKRDAYKNWRLNGEFVYDPEGQAGRFNKMAAGDLAVFDFSGDPAPQKVSLLLISTNAPSDVPLHSSLNGLIPGGRRTMVEISRSQLATAAASTSAAHPVWTLAKDPAAEAALEDVALGGSEGAKKLAKSPLPVSAATLAAAKASAEKNGRDGEALAWLHLKTLQETGKAADIQWASTINAVSPYDFSATIDGSKRYIDAKSTNGDFGRPLHMSLAEVTFAAQAERYDLWRIYDLNADGARMRIAQNIKATAQKILAGVSMPAGIKVDGVSIDPSALNWDSEVVIARPDDDEGMA